MTQQYDVAIVGAGLAGLMAARALALAGWGVLAVDKGRSVGGRMATRRIGGGLADHGAQFFTTRDPQFGEFVRGWVADGLVYEWARGWAQGWNNGSGDTAPVDDGHPRYAVRGGMNALTRRLEMEAANAGAQIIVDATVSALRNDADGWQISYRRAGEGEEDSVSAAALILTPPVPQSLRLLANGGVALPDDGRQALEAIQYQPCIALLARVQGGATLPPPGAIQRPDAAIAWIADNQAKGISPDERLWTLHGNGDFSRRWYEEPDESVIQAFQTELTTMMPDVQFVDRQVKRWRYSQPISAYPERTLRIDLPSPLLFAGDAFGGPRVEGAALSGLAAAENLLR